jgi:glycerol-3-phosphate acyltransferase PlsY
MTKLLCVLIGYGFGCIQTAYIVGRLTRNIDVREHGSGNAGTSNVIRVIGKRAGIIVFVCDVLKAVAAYALCAMIFEDAGFGAFSMFGLYAGLGVVLGHNFPVFLQFRGGKGIAPTLGAIMLFDIRAAACVYAVGLAILIWKRYMSLTSLSMTLVMPAVFFAFRQDVHTLLILLAMTLMAFWMHRGNIKRLLNGTERKLIIKKKKDEAV